MNTLLFSQELCGEEGQPALMDLALKGVQLDGQDIKVSDYISTILKQVISRVKGVPPFKRKVIDLKMILDTLS